MLEDAVYRLASAVLERCAFLLQTDPEGTTRGLRIIGATVMTDQVSDEYVDDDGDEDGTADEVEADDLKRKNFCRMRRLQI